MIRANWSHKLKRTAAEDTKHFTLTRNGFHWVLEFHWTSIVLLFSRTVSPCKVLDFCHLRAIHAHTPTRSHWYWQTRAIGCVTNGTKYASTNWRFSDMTCQTIQLISDFSTWSEQAKLYWCEPIVKSMLTTRLKLSRSRHSPTTVPICDVTITNVKQLSLMERK